MFGGCFDPEFAEDSTQFFRSVRSKKFIILVSETTQAEIVSAPTRFQNVLRSLPSKSIVHATVSEEIEGLAEAYISDGALTDSSYNDALHVATASVYHADLILSWNFRHLVNIDRIRQFNAVNLRKGYTIIDIRSPKELSYEEEV